MCLKIQTLWSKDNCFKRVKFLKKYSFVFVFFFYIKTLCQTLPADLSLQWSLVCTSAWEVHIAKFALLVGSSFGYLVFGILADW